MIPINFDVEDNISPQDYDSDCLDEYLHQPGGERGVGRRGGDGGHPGERRDHEQARRE